MTPRRLLFLAPVVVFVGVAAAFFFGLGHDPSIIPSVMIDKPAPQFDLPALLDDKPGLATADLRGAPSLVNIFASWCVPCRVEHPLLMRLAAERALPIYGINYKDAPEDAKRWLDELGDPYDRIGVDRDGRASIDWGVYGVPETFLIDRDARIVFKQVGPLTPDVVDETLLPMLRDLEK